MEMAIGVMFLMIAFTIMLLSTAGLQNRHRNEDYKKFNQMIEVNNVGEYVLQNRIDYVGINAESIKINVEDVEYTVVLTTEKNADKTLEKYIIYRGDVESGELVLTIVIDDNDTPEVITDDKITSWK